MLDLRNVDPINQYFPLYRLYWSYYRLFNRMIVVQEAWLRASIQLYKHPPNETGFFRCSLKLMSTIFRLADGTQ